MYFPGGAGHSAMTLDSCDPTRVLVSDANPGMRAAMADSIRAIGYEVVQIDQLGTHLPPDVQADFAVVRCFAGEMGGLAEGESSNDASPRLAIGWLRPGWSHPASLAATAEAQRDEHVVRIFSAIAPLFIDIDPERAERLARGMHALRSSIWGASVPAAANGGWPPTASDRRD